MNQLYTFNKSRNGKSGWKIGTENRDGKSKCVKLSQISKVK